MSKIYCNLSLNELENAVWLEPQHTSHLVETCHALRKIPLRKLTVENIRMLVGQKIGLEYLIPMAIEHLEKNPWCSGDYYDGDLLEVVLRVDAEFWHEHPNMQHRLSEVMSRIQGYVELYSKQISPSWDKLSKSM